MKIFSKFPLALIIITLSFLPFITLGSITGKTPVCPNEEEYYSDNAAPSGQYTWTVTSGSGIITTASSGTDLKTIKIRWNDTRQTTKIQLTVEYKDGSGNTQYYTKDYKIAIKSVNGLTLPALKVGLAGSGTASVPPLVNGNYVYNIPWCNNGQKYIFATDPPATFHIRTES